MIDGDDHHVSEHNVGLYSKIFTTSHLQLSTTAIARIQLPAMGPMCIDYSKLPASTFCDRLRGFQQSLDAGPTELTSRAIEFSSSSRNAITTLAVSDKCSTESVKLNHVASSDFSGNYH